MSITEVPGDRCNCVGVTQKATPNQWTVRRSMLADLEKSIQSFEMRARTAVPTLKQTFGSLRRGDQDLGLALIVLTWDMAEILHVVCTRKFRGSSG